MNETAFDKFVSEQLGIAAGEQQNNWEQKKASWILALEELYELIEELIKPYTKDGGIRMDYSKIILNEEFIGEYEVKSCAILIGKTAVRLSPIGTNLVGAKGRVDVLGPKGRGRFVLVDEAYVSASSKIKQLKTPGRTFAWRIVYPTCSPYVQGNYA